MMVENWKGESENANLKGECKSKSKRRIWRRIQKANPNSKAGQMANFFCWSMQPNRRMCSGARLLLLWPFQTAKNCKVYSIKTPVIIQRDSAALQTLPRPLYPSLSMLCSKHAKTMFNTVACTMALYWVQSLQATLSLAASKWLIS